MARRMIRARRASPYLLYLVIAFSILMVACAIGWGWSYSKMSQMADDALGRPRVEQATISAPELLREKSEQYKTNLVDAIEQREDLANKYRAEVIRLIERMNGNAATTLETDQLRVKASDALKTSNDTLVQAGNTLRASFAVGDTSTAADVTPQHLEAAVAVLAKRIDALVLQVKQDSTAKDTLDGQIKGLQDELGAAKAEHARQVAQVNSQLEDEKKRLAEARDNAVNQTGQFEERLKEATDRLIAERRQGSTDKSELSKRISILENDLKSLSQELADYRKVPTETGVDGHIVNVAEQGIVAYGDLGKKDGILLGMPFSIFSPTELGKTTPQPKAQCRIVKIMDNSCELRIYELHAANPVVVGDVLHNPVYDRTRRLRFILVGKMDLDGDGIDDSEQLKALIQEFGGRIDTSLTVQSDYLVVGEEPAVASPPALDASPQERVQYEGARKTFIEYTETRARAETFSIPVLSLNRFLGLVGLAGQS